MKILHFGDYLPDERIERIAILGNRLGHKCFYIGRGIKGTSIEEDIFRETAVINIRARHNAGIDHEKFLLSLKGIIDRFDPDIIHAHDIYNANMVYRICPERLIYDDHEYWSEQVKYSPVYKLLKIFPEPKSFLISRILKSRVPKWEEELRKNAVIIASSIKIKELHQDRGAERVSYLPNMPLLSEVSGVSFLVPESKQLTCAYVGSDLTSSYQYPYRNTKGLDTMFIESEIGKLLVLGDNKLHTSDKIESLGYIPHLEVYKQLSRAHVGLHGFKPHPALSYKASQKIHMYVHAGCVPFVTPESLEALPYLKEMAITYKDYSDLKHKLIEKKKELMEHSHEEIRRWARENMVVDNFESELIEAYKNVANG